MFHSLSVVIPTYNRSSVLAKALESYLGQSSPSMIHEVIVVDDGSTDATEQVVKDFSRRASFAVRHLKQTNKGPAAARNWGIREAGSDLILFTDSDILCTQELVRLHVEFHQHNPELSSAMLGFVDWSPEIQSTPFMRWFGNERLFAFKRLHGGCVVPFHCFYTANLSLKTTFLRKYGQFDEEFNTAAYEDTELGFRLIGQGLKLFYNPEALTYHHQFFSFDDAVRKTLDNTAPFQIFLRKEAGQAERLEIELTKSKCWPRIRKALTTNLAELIPVPRRLLNSSVALPDLVYDFLFRTSIARGRRKSGIVGPHGKTEPQHRNARDPNYAG